MKLDFRPKLFTLLKQGISREQLSKDIMAGLIVTVVALPLSIAFAVASGISPEKGLVTAVISGFLISFFGGSRVQIGGPSGSFIVISAMIVSQFGTSGLIVCTIMAGMFLILFGLLKLGDLLKYIPQPLVIGFTSGMAIIIFTTQIKDAFGLTVVGTPQEFLERWTLYIGSMHTVNLYAVGITLVTMFIAVFAKKITSRIPGAFIAIIVITAGVALFDLPVNTIETLYGDIPGSFTFSAPVVEWTHLSDYIKPALSIALLCSIESLLSAVVSDGMIGANHRSNTELIAQGIANMTSPFFGGIPAAGAMARTATNINNGGRTPIAGIVNALALLLVVLFFGKWAKLIPMSCLAGILIIVAYNMSEWRSFCSIMRASAFDILILLTTFFLTLLVDLTLAIQIGVVLSALLFMKRMADTAMPAKETLDADLLENYSNLSAGVSVYEIDGPFFFGSAKSYGEVLKDIGVKSRVLIIRMRHVPFIDATGINNLEAAIHIILGSGTTIILSGVNPNVYSDLRKANIHQIIGDENICSKFDDAVSRSREVVGK